MSFDRTITLQQPPRITFGAGCAADAVATFIRERSLRRAFMVTSPSVRHHAAAMAASLASLGVEICWADGEPAEPTLAAAEALRDRVRAFAPDIVVAAGGGSVLDTAKVAAALHDKPGPISDYFGLNLVPARRTALIAVPTTAGTGSEVSPNSILLDEASSTKKAVISPALVPDAAVVDPVLTLTLPPALTATTGIDALTHCLEVYANLSAHAATDANALEGVRLIAANLPRAVSNGSDVAARSAVALGSLYGGLGLGPVNTAAVHALAYPLGGEHHLSHGTSIALLLSHVARFNAPAMPGRHAALSVALGADARASVEEAASECADRLDALLRACDAPRGLGSCGIPRDALPGLADAALGVTRLLKNNPRPVTREDALRIYSAAF
ncbi:alcohol dehydrogenase 2 [mine drainage metagenome]|uniref:Alcohol dehydrogenase 2 n=1 Tax=mine drainage metagenome TaxID=410659 RepID=A0A1J5T0X9_9ZZZZ